MQYLFTVHAGPVNFELPCTAASNTVALESARNLADTYRATVIVYRLEGSHGVTVRTRIKTIVNTDAVLK